MKNLSVFGYLKWLLWTARLCQHEPGDWRMRDWGMGKIRYCRKCGKCVGII